MISDGNYDDNYNDGIIRGEPNKLRKEKLFTPRRFIFLGVKNGPHLNQVEIKPSQSCIVHFYWLI